MTKERRKGRFWNRLGIALLIPVLALLSLSFIVHIPLVQTWGIRQISTYISKKTKSEVDIRRFDFNIFKHFELNDFYVAKPGQPADTLIYAERLRVRFTNLLSLTKNRLTIRDVRLDDALLDFEKEPGAEMHTLAIVLSRLFENKPDQPTREGKLAMRVGTVAATDLAMRYDDRHAQSRHVYRVPALEVAIDIVDFRTRELIVDDIQMDGAFIRVESYGEAGAVERTPAPDSTGWRITMCHAGVTNGAFQLINPSPTPRLVGMDYNQLDVRSVDLSLDDFWMQGMHIGGIVGHLSLVESSGFEITSFEALEVAISPQEIVLNEFQLQTPQSTLSRSLVFRFDDIREVNSFADDVEMIGVFDESRIAIDDLLLAIPVLQDNAFFVQNADEDIVLNGVVRGSLNRLRGESLEATIGPLAFKGAFRSRNLTIPDEQILNLTVDDATFSADALNETLPGLALPAQFRKLGRIRFEGRFDGFFQDFVAFGSVRSRIGNANLDMRLDLKPGRTLAQYSGNIELVNFDLRTWTDNPDLGTIRMEAHVREGRGLTAESANVRLDGKIHAVTYKGYVYEDVQLNGLLDKNFFDGSMVIEDDNINLSFLGSVDFSESAPNFDFEAQVRNVDFQALNLTEEPLTLSGLFDVAGSFESINAIDGRATASKVVLTRGTAERYTLDTINLVSQRSARGERVMNIQSDYVNGLIRGQFDFRNVYPQIVTTLNLAYPDRIPPPPQPPDSAAVAADMMFDLVFNDPQEWIALLELPNFTFRDVRLVGDIDTRNNDLRLNFNIPALHVGNLNVYEARGSVQSLGMEASGSMDITAFDIDEKHFFDDLSLDFSGSNRHLDWHFVTDDLLVSVNKLDLRGSITQDEQGTYTARIEPQDLVLFNDPWRLNPDNRVIWNAKSIMISDFTLQHAEERISLRSVDRRGILLDVEGFDARYVNQLWTYDNLSFGGGYSLTLMIEDIFERKGFYTWLAVPELAINGESYGTLVLDGRMEVAGLPVEMSVNLDETDSHIRADGWYYPPLDEVPEELRNTLDMNIRLDTFPLQFLEYILGDGIRNTRGSLIGDMRLHGPMSRLDMEGTLRTMEGATTVSYLGARYTFHDQIIQLTGDRISMDGAEIRDRNGNIGRVTGGLTHQLFSDFGLDARITANRLIALNTTKQDNPLYHGFGIGSIDARFSGTTSRPNISVDATALAGTRVAITVEQNGVEGEETFIRFVKKDSTGTVTVESDEQLITGMNFDMNLSMTPEAQVEIIFDERTEDIIKVTGQGDLQLEITRSGDFTMYGLYELAQGDYLFTNFVLNKPFEIVPGGTLRWTGDPFDAQMDIQATYTGLRTSLRTFLEEYLINASPQAKEEASLKRSVELTMYLTGSLLEPSINFSIRFPELTGELAGYADSKLRILESNQNALNEQVFGLLWAGTFLPSNVLQNSSTTQLAGSGIYNTLSEFFSTQLSQFLSEFLERAVEDVDFISGIDFDVGYNKSYDFDLQDYSYSEWELRMKNRLFDDRIILDVGGNYITDSPVIPSGTYFAGDYALEYVLTADRRLKIRFYHRNEWTIEGRKSKVGLGLSYRREFDSFGEWLQGLDREAKKLKKNTETTPSPDIND
ncbi:MAG: translocation/assembly module TamB domain-containing protein [Saprospiraceae bacterium]|nr:translocation/assembly module TamB domain-containing protein [Saprospiraceae bacterium]